MNIYLDSCIVIYLIEGSPPYHDAVEAALRMYRPTRTVLSDLVRLECRVGPLRQRRVGYDLHSSSFLGQSDSQEDSG